MSSLPEQFSTKRTLFRALFIPFIFAFFMFVSFVLEKGMHWNFRAAGLVPRSVNHLYGILTYAFVHASWGHLVNNVISYLVLGSFLFYFYRAIALRIFILTFIFSGVLLWIIGRDSFHIGASGWVYSLAFFLFFSGIFRSYIPLIAVSLVVALNYGDMIWHIFPWEAYDPVSWEGHLAGAFTGLLLAVFYRKQGPQKPVKVWEDEDDDIEYISDDEDENERD